MLSVRFWGVRGTSPSPGQATALFGGNTSCIELRADERLVIIDLGTGLRPLGNHLMANDLKNRPIEADVFVTHTHWDHIIGFPVFSPLFLPTTSLKIWGPISDQDEALENIFREQLDYKFWPVRLEEFSAQIKFCHIQEGELDLGGGLVVKSKVLNHSALCFGYRFEYQGKSVVTIYDHETFYPCDESVAEEAERAAKEENEKIAAFFKDADILIHDAQYTAEEYHSGKHGWGHTCYEDAIASIQASGVKKAVLFHHDPNRTDDQLAFFEKKYQIKNNVSSGLLAKMDAFKNSPRIIMAREGMTITA